jgi:hypothetical protein
VIVIGEVVRFAGLARMGGGAVPAKALSPLFSRHRW